MTHKALGRALTTGAMAEERVPPPMEETPDFLADDDDDGDIFAATPKPKVTGYACVLAHVLLHQ